MSGKVVRNGYFTKKYTTREARDTGMAMVLICLIVFLFTSSRNAIWIGTGLLASTMMWPGLFKPAARVWFGLSFVIGTVVSKILLSAVFFLLVTPMGLVRRMAGKDPLRLKPWKKDKASVFVHRDHSYEPDDLDAPY